MQNTVYTKIEDAVALVTIARPEAYNAFDEPTLVALAQATTQVCRDPNVRAVVITGEGKAFCGGGDLKWMQQQAQGISTAVYRLAGLFHECTISIRRAEKPVIAAINGPAAGGGFSLALACDFRVMHKNAVLRQAYTTSGLCMDGGGSFFLPRLVGHARALEIAAFDPAINAELALQWGLATRIAENAVEDALTMAHELSQKAVGAFGRVKLLFNDVATLETQLENERRGIAASVASAEGQEGINAFAEKRKPKFC